MRRLSTLLPLLAVASLALGEDQESLTVDQAVERGRQSQPALRLAVDNVEVAHQRIGEAIAPFLPQANGTATWEPNTSNYVANPGLAKLLSAGNTNGPTACLNAAGQVVPCIADAAIRGRTTPPTITIRSSSTSPRTSGTSGGR